MRIALYGGSFDPIHHGHLIAARGAVESLSLDRLIFLPTAHPPHKGVDVGLDPAHRGEMVRLAIEGESAFSLDDHDLKRPGPTYTIDTVEHFKRALGEGVVLHWLIGADSLLDLTTWRRAGDLVDGCELVTLARPGWDTSQIDRLAEVLNERQIERLRRNILETALIEISATDVRARIRAGRSVRYLLPDVVRCYIEEHGLYRAAADR